MKNCTFLVYLLSFVLLGLASCTSVTSSDEAGVVLTGPEKWHLEEVVVNGKPVFKNGRLIEQFGEVTFDRYMEEVWFEPDGIFRGRFNHNNQEMSLLWSAEEHAVVVGDTIATSRTWQIPYATLNERSFEMTTETSAYDPPNLTRVTLRFVSALP